MKATVEIDAELLREAKKRAVEEGITIGTLTEQALKERLERATPAHGPLGNWTIVHASRDHSPGDLHSGSQRHRGGDAPV